MNLFIGIKFTFFSTIFQFPILHPQNSKHKLLRMPPYLKPQFNDRRGSSTYHPAAAKASRKGSHESSIPARQMPICRTGGLALAIASNRSFKPVELTLASWF